jgi:uncharacterized protein with FMN-binding domain
MGYGDATAVKPTISMVVVGSTSKTLATLLGEAVATTTRKITLIPVADGIYMASGAASAASLPLGLNVIELDGTVNTLDELQFYAAANTSMGIVQEG